MIANYGEVISPRLSLPKKCAQITPEAIVKNAFPRPFIKPKNHAWVPVLIKVDPMKVITCKIKPIPVIYFGLILSAQYPMNNEDIAKAAERGMKYYTASAYVNP